MKNKSLKLKLLASALLMGLSMMSLESHAGIFGKMFLNEQPEYIDPKNEYIIKPDLAMYKKFDWATWRDTAGGRMSHDPKYFILPSDKYIPKEVAFDWSKYKGKTALEKRNAYYAHLCTTESVGYETESHPQDMRKDTMLATSTWFYTRTYEEPVKNMKEELIKNKNNDKYKNVFKVANQNPYLNSNLGYHDWNENMTLLFDFRDADEYYYKQHYGQPKKDTFREYMLSDGRIFRIRFDIKSNKYLPLQEIKLEDVKAQYHLLWREIERPQMEKLGIKGRELIVIDKYNNKLTSYFKFFEMPLYMDSLRASGQDVPIDWARSSGCADQKPKIIKEFN